MRTAIRSIFLLCSATVLHAQTSERPPRFALEISDTTGAPSRFLVVQADQDGQQQNMDFGLPGSPQPDSDEAVTATTRLPSIVRLGCKTDGDAVLISASFVLGSLGRGVKDSSHQDPTPHAMGDYSLRLNEAVVLEDMAQFGLPPWTIKIVTAQVPTTADISTASKVPSVQVEVLGEDRAGVRLGLHILSPQPIVAFLVTRVFKGPPETFTESHFYGWPTGPGESHEIHLSCDTSNETPGASVSNPGPCNFVLEAATFADGSYEGEAHAAASLELPRIAAETQRLRVHDLISGIVSDSSMTAIAKIARIRSELPALSAKRPDQETITQIRLRFPGLSPDLGDLAPRLNGFVRLALDSEKNTALRALTAFESSHSADFSDEALDQWLAALESER